MKKLLLFFLVAGVLLPLYGFNFYSGSNAKKLSTSRNYLYPNRCTHVSCSFHGSCETKYNSRTRNYYAYCNCYDGYHSSGNTGCVINEFGGEWTFDSNSEDFSGNDYKSSDHNVTYVSDGILGGAVEFSGANSYVEIDDLLTVPDFSTIGFWVRPVDNSDQIFLSKNKNDNSNEFSIGYHYGQISVKIGNEEYRVHLNYYLDQWQHFTVVVEKYSKVIGGLGNRVILYQNGEKLGENKFVGVAAASNKPWIIGKFNGRMDELKFYNDVLTDSEISSIFAQTDPCHLRPVCGEGICFLDNNVAKCPCDNVDCSGHGACVANEYYDPTTAHCECDPGFGRPYGNPTDCVVDPEYFEKSCNSQEEGVVGYEINGDSISCVCENGYFEYDNQCHHMGLFKDENFSHCVGEVLGKDSSYIFTKSDLNALATITTLDCSGRNISDITGIGYLENLVDADFENNNIADLTPLKNLSNYNYKFKHTPMKFVMCGENPGVRMDILNAQNETYYCPNQAAKIKVFGGMDSEGNSLPFPSGFNDLLFVNNPVHDKFLCYDGAVEKPLIKVERTYSMCPSDKRGIIVSIGLEELVTKEEKEPLFPVKDKFLKGIENDDSDEPSERDITLSICSPFTFPEVKSIDVLESGTEEDREEAALKCGRDQPAKKFTVFLKKVEVVNTKTVIHRTAGSVRREYETTYETITEEKISLVPNYSKIMCDNSEDGLETPGYDIYTLGYYNGEPGVKCDLKQDNPNSVSDGYVYKIVFGQKRVPKLELLNLSQNSVGSLEGFKYLHNLKFVTLSNNNLSTPEIIEYDGILTPDSFLEELFNLENLLEVDFDANDISRLDGVEKTGKLELLYMADNNVSDTSLFSRLTKLRILDISNNRQFMTTGVDNFLTPLSDLNELQALDASGNDIRNLVGLEGVERPLHYLYLQNNTVSDLSPLTRLSKLKELNISNNKIYDLYPLIDLYTIEALYMSHNDVYSIDPITYLPNIQYLDISDVNIEKLSGNSMPLNNVDFLDNYYYLMGVNFSDNEVRAIDHLENNPYLQYIYMNSNYVENVSAFNNLIDLQELDLASNCIDSNTLNLYSSVLLNEGDQYNQSNCLNITNSQDVTGLIVDIGFNEGAGSAALDSAGNIQDHASLASSVSWADENCLLDSCIRFEKSDEKQAGNSVSLIAPEIVAAVNNDFSFVLFVKPVEDGVVLTDKNSDFSIRTVDNGSLLIIYEGDNKVKMEVSLQMNTWNAFIWTQSKEESKIYINNSNKFLTIPTPLIPNIATSSLRFGYGKSPLDVFKGYIDEFSFYNRVISMTEIDTLLTNMVHSVEAELEEKEYDNYYENEEGETSVNSAENSSASDSIEESSEVYSDSCQPYGELRTSGGGKAFCLCDEGYHTFGLDCIADDSRKGKLRPLTETEKFDCHDPSMADCYDEDYLATECGALHAFRTCNRYTDVKYWKKLGENGSVDSSGKCSFEGDFLVPDSCDSDEDCLANHLCNDSACALRTYFTLTHKPFICVKKSVIDFSNFDGSDPDCFLEERDDSCNLSTCKWVQSSGETEMEKCLPAYDFDDITMDEYKQLCFNEDGTCNRESCDYSKVCFEKQGEGDRRFEEAEKGFAPAVSRTVLMKNGRAKKIRVKPQTLMRSISFAPSNYIQLKNYENRIVLNNRLRLKRVAAKLENSTEPLIQNLQTSIIPKKIRVYLYSGNQQASEVNVDSGYDPTSEDLEKEAVLSFMEESYADIKNALPTSRWTPLEPVDSCEQYTHVKYYDYSRYLQFATLLSDDPLTVMKLTLDGEDSNSVPYVLPTYFKSITQMIDYDGSGTVPDLFIDGSKTLGYKLFGYEGTELYSSGEQTGYDYSNDAFFMHHPLMGEKMLPIGDEAATISKEKNIFFRLVKMIEQSSSQIDEIPYISKGMMLSSAISGEFGISLPQTVINGVKTGEDEFSVDLLKYRQLVNSGNIDALRENYEYIKTLRERLRKLLLNRANLERIWNQKKEIVKELHPEDFDYYDVADIKEETKDILASLSEYTDVSHISHEDDIYDSALLIKLQQKDEDGVPEITIEEALKIARRDEKLMLKDKLRLDIMTNKFSETENAEKLWGKHHFGKVRYLLDVDSDDHYYNKIVDRKDLFPRGDTEYLINVVLREIDEEITTVYQLPIF